MIIDISLERPFTHGDNLFETENVETSREGDKFPTQRISFTPLTQQSLRFIEEMSYTFRGASATTSQAIWKISIEIGSYVSFHWLAAGTVKIVIL